MNWIKAGYTLFVITWALIYFLHYGLINFLWLCDIANIITLIGLWLNHTLLVSSQAVLMIPVMIIWSSDVIFRIITGKHIIVNATQYMFDPSIPLYVRLFSCFHIITPVVIVWFIVKKGYHRKAWIIQSLITCVVLPVTYLVSDPERNINFIQGLFQFQKTEISPIWNLFISIIGAILFIYLPVDRIMRRVFKNYSS